jgi:tRNA (guanine37-N1)-methyltransferase
MDFSVVTIFPEIFNAYLDKGIIGKACEKRIINVDVLDLRDFTRDRHRTVDDVPYGGGPGMVMKPEPFEKAVEHVKADGADTMTIMMTPGGRPFDQRTAERLSKETRRLLFLCGRYEGIDERVREAFVDEDISVGDYVLTGGELPALVIIDAVVRLLPGVVGDKASLKEESFSWGILDYPHYTRPTEWRGLRVPEALLSGNHKEIERFRRKEALRRTLKRRPDLLERVSISEEDRNLISDIKEEEE